MIYFCEYLLVLSVRPRVRTVKHELPSGGGRITVKINHELQGGKTLQKNNVKTAQPSPKTKSTTHGYADSAGPETFSRPSFPCQSLSDLLSLTFPFKMRRCHEANEMMMEMVMDSHGGLEVTIRQTESKKKTTQQLRETKPLSARNEHQSHPLAGQAQACGRLIRRMDRGPDGTC